MYRAPILWIAVPCLLAAGQQALEPRPNVPVVSQPVANGSQAGGTHFVAAFNATLAERNSADWVCDGSADQLELQAALNSLAGSGGRVTLSSGTFQVSAAVKLVGRVALQGQGRGTTIRATSAFQSGEGILDGVYAGVGTPLDLVTVSHLTIDGNRFGGANAQGVHVNISSKLGFQYGSPDACFALQHVMIARTSSHGVHIQGSNNRAARIIDVRVWDVNGDGFLVDSPDGNYTDCDTGSSLGAGFHITSANNHFIACKAWFSDLAGFEIGAVRNTFTGCSAQDNEQHGFAIRAGMTTMSGCHADSNSYKGGGANPDPNQGLYDGFHIASNNVTLSACFGYDKNEGGRGRNQRYGTYVDGTRTRLNLQVANGSGSSHDNFSGGIGGTLNGAGTRIVATGQNEYVTP